MRFFYFFLGFYWLISLISFMLGKFEPGISTIGTAMFCTSGAFFMLGFDNKTKGE